MKKYYSEVTIDYFDNTIDQDNPEGKNPFETCITRSVILEAKNDINALEKVFKDAINNLKNEGYDPKVNFINRFIIESFYETTKDASAD